MHRIDGPGATVDNKFTEGNPVGGAPATVVSADWMNDVQEELISILSSAGITPVKGAQDQMLKAIRTISSGVIGAFTNGRMVVTSASASATFIADEVVVGSAIGGLAYKLSAFSKTINLAAVGAGGMDTGLAPANGFVALYAIFNPATGVSSILATNAATLQGTVYAGANMPAGFSASALIGVWPTNSSRQFVPALQTDRSLVFTDVNALSSSVQQPSAVALSLATIIPLNAKNCSGVVDIKSSVSPATLWLRVYGSSGATLFGQQLVYSGASVATVSIASSFVNLPMLVPQTIYYIAVASAGTMTANISITGYSF